MIHPVCQTLRQLFCPFRSVQAAIMVCALVGQIGQVYQATAEELFEPGVPRPVGIVAFVEGPAWHPTGNVYFSDGLNNRIMRRDRTGAMHVFRQPSGAANGLLFDPDGRLRACEGGAGRVTRTDLGTGKMTVLADEYENFPLAAPNDLALLKSGTLFFTSRPGTPDPTKGNPNAVYQLDLGTEQPGGRILHRVLEWKTIHMPNGIVSSPDDKVLYLIEAHPDAGHHRLIYAYQLDSDTCWTKPRTLINFSPGRSGDGMCIDAEGNLYIACLLYTSPSPRDGLLSRMPSSA